MGQAMSASLTLTEAVGTGERPSFACWFCGPVNGTLAPVGEITLDDGTRAWSVTTCSAHQGRRLA
ncbi:hypothetical protein EDD93_2214 [Streptomyces sp. 840.1]|nr:hypothetical protein EDD93_2214 [Streptomyces sp. 840.1]